MKCCEKSECIKKGEGVQILNFRAVPGPSF